jgi:hypothetical protein
MIQPGPVVPVVGGVYGILSGLPTDALEPVEVVRLEGEGDSVFCRYVDVELSAKFGTWQVSAKSLEPLNSEVVE